MCNAEPLAEARGLSKVYVGRNKSNPLRKQSIKALNRLDLTIRVGETFGLVGESGCGKSTAGQLMAGLLAPTGGELLYRGQSLQGMNGQARKAMRREIQIVMQDPYASLNPKHRIGWIIEEPLTIHCRLTRAQRARLVAETLDNVGLDESYLSRYPHELSGGQRQRVSIAAALMLKPSLLIADEVVSALDVSIQAQILNLMRTLQQAQKLTYLFISHDLNVVQYMSDRIGVMYLGQLVEVGRVEDIYGGARHPYTQALLSMMLSVDAPKRQRIAISGEVPSLLNPPTGCPFHTRCRFRQAICEALCPALTDLGNGHAARCHFAKP